MKLELPDRLVAELVAQEIAAARLKGELMTTKEVADYLSVTPPTVRKLPIPSATELNCRNGRRYRRSDVDAYIESRTIRFDTKARRRA